VARPVTCALQLSWSTSTRQLTGLFATAHWPDAHAQAAEGDLYRVAFRTKDAGAAFDEAADLRIRCVASGDRMVPVDGGPARDLRAAAVTVDLDATAHRPLRHRPLARRPRAATEGDLYRVVFRKKYRKKNPRKGASIRALALRDLWAGRHGEPRSPQRAVHRCLSVVTRSANPPVALADEDLLNPSQLDEHRCGRG
jgi:hypothetical protein